MKNQFDHEQAGREDILARPEVTGDDAAMTAPVPPKKRHDGAKDAAIDGVDAGPDIIEIAAGKFISKAIDELKVFAGMESDRDFTVLMTETLSGMFAAIRGVTGRPWVRFAVAAGAIGISFIPPYLRYRARQNQQEEPKK
jgi:hypothetical protein